MRTFLRRIAALALSVTVLTSSVLVSDTVLADDDDDEETESEVDESDIDNFAKALQYSIYFYDANMCGTEVSETSAFSWRGDCHTYDAEVAMDTDSTNLSEEFLEEYADILDPDGDGYIDVSGGFHDAGDHVKFGMPQNYAAATLGWGYYEFRESYEETGQDEHIETVLRYFNDYLMKCTFLDEDGNVIAHCYQVGDGDIDHQYWQSPELDEMDRPAYFLTADKPQTDYVASAAASLAINYLNFKDTDPEYAETSLEYALALFEFAQTNEKELSDNSDGPKSYYYSSEWEDDYCWAAAWLYKITEDYQYLEEIFPYYDYYAAPSYVYCWNDMWSGVQCILGEITLEQYPDFITDYKEYAGKSEYEEMDCWDSIADALDNYMDGSIGTITPDGYFWLSTWGSARYNTAAQLIALVYDKYNNDGEPSEYSDWAKGQMEYLLGDNSLERCYVVGYNENSVKYPHHRAASGLSSAEDTSEQRHVLYGALVGGPDANDEHNDVTSDYIYNEVTIDYNAAFVGACAGLYAYYGDDTMSITEDFPPAEDEDESGNEYWVSAYGVDDPQTSGAGVTKVTMLVYTTSTEGKTDLSVRYYFSVEEMDDTSNVSLVSGSELYDQAAVEAEDADGVLSGPYQYDASYDPNIYYVEVSFDGYKIANSNKKYQFTVGLYYGDNWDPDNDWSYQDLVIESDTYQDGAEERTDYICVYSDGVLVGGIEPDGTTVSEDTDSEVLDEESTEDTEDSEDTSTEEGTSEEEDSSEDDASSSEEDTESSDILYGDVTLDNNVTLADAVLLNQYVADIADLSDQAIDNGDVNIDNAIDGNDVSVLLRYQVNLIDTLPQSS